MSDAPWSGRGLDPETLAAYVDGRLPPEDRAWVEAALVKDPELYEWLVHTMRAEQHVNAMVPAEPPLDEDEPQVVEPRGRPYAAPFYRHRAVLAVGSSMLGVAAALVAVFGLQAGWWAGLSNRSADPRIASLVAAVADERTLEGRLGGGFHYAPIRPVTRSASDLSNQNLALLAAAGELQKSARTNPTAENLHAWGLAQLLLGDFDAAIDTLNTTARLQPSSAAFLSDLAVAHLGRYTATGSANDLPAAFERVEEALTLAPESEEGLFNRVRVLTAMGLPAEARAALQQYLRRDPSSEWAVEARRIVDQVKPRSALDPELGAALAALEVGAEPDGSDPQAIREFIEEELLGRYVVKAPLDQRSSALDRVARVGARLAELQGDELVTHAIADWRRATPDRAEALASAFACYAQARALQRSVRTKEMGELASHCSALFRDLSSPYLRWTSLLEARAAQTAGNFERARSLASAIAADSATNLYPITTAAANVQLAAIAYLQSRYANASASLIDVIERFEAAGEWEQAAAACDLRASALFEGGDRGAAWAEYLRALRLLPERRQSVRWHATRTSFALALLNSARPRAAAEIFAVNLESATANQLSIAVAESNRNLARAEELLGNSAAVLAHLEAAERAFAMIGDEAARERSRAELLLAQARHHSETAPEQALQHARESQAIFTRLRIQPRLAPVKLFEARVALKAAGPAQAIVAADEGVRLISLQERQLPTVRQREAFRVANADIYREATSALVAANDAKGSMLRLEQLRRIGDELPVLDDLEAARARLAGDTVVVAFAFHGSRLHRWVIDRDGVTVRSTTIDPARVAMLASAAKAALQVGAGLGTDLHRELSGLLLDALPLSALQASRWVVVPDGPLFGVPFSMLLNGDGSVVAELREVAVASSFLAYVTKHHNAEPTSALLTRAAVFAATETAMKVRALPGARQEGLAVAALYGARPLIGSAATPAAFLSALGTSPVVHFSGHAILNPHDPGRSLLLLAPSGAQPLGALFPSDIEQVRASARVVVLAGCSTAESVEAQGEGVSSIARSFVKAGVPWVIATLWPIGDQLASEVFVELHQLLLRNIPPPTAVKMIQSQRARAGRWDPVRSSLVVLGA